MWCMSVSVAAVYCVVPTLDTVLCNLRQSDVYVEIQFAL